MVLAVDSPPPTLATADTYAATEDLPLTVEAPGVRANDNPGATSCVVAIDVAGLAGSVELHSDGSFIYTPPANFNGETSFTYEMRSTGDSLCAGPADTEGTATVTINVAAVNDAPTASNDSFQILVSRTLNVRAPGLLINDNDIDGDTLTVSLVTGVSHGTLVLASNGSFAYTPPSGYLGPDGFSYRASDGSLTSPPRVVTLSVVAVPTPIPTLAPTPTPIPSIESTVAPTVEPTSEPTQPDPTAVETTLSTTVAPAATVAPSTRASLLPGPTVVPAPTAGSGAGPSLPVLLAIILFAVLVAFGAALYVPRWLNAARTGEPPEDD